MNNVAKRPAKYTYRLYWDKTKPLLVPLILSRIKSHPKLVTPIIKVIITYRTTKKVFVSASKPINSQIIPSAKVPQNNNFLALMERFIRKYWAIPGKVVPAEVAIASTLPIIPFEATKNDMKGLVRLLARFAKKVYALSGFNNGQLTLL